MRMTAPGSTTFPALSRLFGLSRAAFALDDRDTVYDRLYHTQSKGHLRCILQEALLV